MKFRLIGFVGLTAINIYVTYSLWETLLISTLPACLIFLSVFCSGLFFINVKSKPQRDITYFIAVVIFATGLFFAIHYRRPLGFLATFSSATVIVKNFISGPNSKEKLLAKIISTILLLAIALTIVFTGLTFSYTNKSLANGTGVLWDANHEKQFDKICSGALTDAQDLLNVPMVDIPNSLRKRIANFLDEKCGKIDRYIEKQQQVIEKLKAYKQSVITEAVAKGLDPNVPMKDSGIEWIGMIPEHWSSRRLRYLGTCVNGISKGGEYFGSGYPFVSYGDVYKNMELPSSVDVLKCS